MEERRDRIKYQIADVLYNYYVMNDKFMAVQMPDGRYIPKRIPCSPMIIYDMLNANASLGVYQQQYCRNTIKWVCLDFDSSDVKDIEELVNRYVVPAAEELQKKGIRFLAEFSGRRGIHLWILFKGVTSKRMGFMIVDRLTKQYRQKLMVEEKFGLDLFPAVAGGNGKFGKQVKLPLSVHRKGGQSFFIKDILRGDTKQWIHSFEQKGFWESQLEILSDYNPNDIDDLWEKLDISPTIEEKEHSLLYKKEYLVMNVSLTLENIISAFESSKVLVKIMHRAVEGNLKYLDRLVLAGCLGKINQGELLLDILKHQENYKQNVTRQYLEKLDNRYYPITFNYLYDLYGEELETELDGNSTVLSYIARQLGMAEKVRLLPEQDNVLTKKSRDWMQVIKEKELIYMQYDDEVLDVNDYLEMNNLKAYDLHLLKERIEKIVAGEKQNLGEQKYKKYNRVEEGKEKPRELITLNVRDRIVTTALVYELVKDIRGVFKSYSYNLNFWDIGSIFMPWYNSWKRFQQDAEVYLKLEFFKDYGFIKTDLSSFYDSIYMHALYHQMEEYLGSSTMQTESVKNIFSYLSNYTEKLMRSLHGTIRGVPQGPAYARVLAELFLAAVIQEFCQKHPDLNENCRILRYVDDIYIVFRYIDGNEFLACFEECLQERGLKINHEKTVIYEKIKYMKEWEKEEIFGDGEKNYAIKNIRGLELEEEEQQQEKLMDFERYLTRKGTWNIRDANFILNRYLDPIFVEEYLSFYAETLMTYSIGRGSVYKRLYEELFKRDEWLVRVFKGELYRKIPQNTINFQNFISVVYFEISRIITLDEEQRIRFHNWLLSLDISEKEEKGTVCAIADLIL